MSVASHLGVTADEYDVSIRKWVAHYEEMIAAALSVLADASPAHVVDLGAGTGALSAAVLDAIPGAHVTLVDLDPAMLDVARARLARHGDRATFTCASFHDPLPPCDAVVASLSLHHVHEPTAKQALYAQILRALRPGGVLVIADATVHADGPERARVMREWVAWMNAHGIDESEAHALFAKWAEGPTGDRYRPLSDELAWLAVAGFPRPECFWRRAQATIFGAFRPT